MFTFAKGILQKIISFKDLESHGSGDEYCIIYK